MSHKKPNQSIGCNVCSCKHHCEDVDYCSLSEINVCACANCDSGKAEGESMCGSYELDHR